MTTFGSLKSAIASEIDRSDIDDLIGLAIQTAINTYGQTPYAFNQDVQTTTTEASVGSLGLPPGFFRMVSIKLLQGGTYLPLTKRNYTDIERWDSTDGYSSVPRDYALFQNLVRLYPIPNDAYTVYVSYHRTYPVPTQDSDTHNLIDNAEYLVKCAAKAFVFEHVLQDSLRAQPYQTAAILESNRLQGVLTTQTIPVLAD